MLIKISLQKYINKNLRAGKIVHETGNIVKSAEKIAVNARIEYIEGYSGHADQTWLLNFIFYLVSQPQLFLTVYQLFDFIKSFYVRFIVSLVRCGFGIGID